MFRIYDGREKLYQWDLNRKLIVDDNTIKQVHFANCLCTNAQVCETYTEGELTIVNIPNNLLQEYLDIQVYAYDGEATKHSVTYEVERRTKPSDYVYTETETVNYTMAIEAAREAEQHAQQAATSAAAAEQQAQEAANRAAAAEQAADTFEVDNTLSQRGKAADALATVEKLAPAFSVKDNFVTCKPIGDSFLNIETEFKGKRTGENDPSIDNVRTIVGVNGGKLSYGGKNLFNFKAGVTKLRLVTTNGTVATKFQGYAFTLPTGTYTLHAEQLKTGNYYVYGVINRMDGTVETCSLVQNTNFYTRTISITEGDMIYIYDGVSSHSESAVNDLFNNIFNIQIELGTVATPYEPYNRNEITINFGQAVYGGRYNWTTGTLTIDKACRYYDGSEDEEITISTNGGNTSFFIYNTECDVSGSGLLCDKLKTNLADAYYARDNAIGLSNAGGLLVNVMDIDRTVEAFRYWLANNPIQVVYPLLVPIKVDLTQHEVKAVANTNVINSDMGKTTVKGYESINAVIEELRQAIISLGGNI